MENFDRLKLLKLPVFRNLEELSTLIHIDTHSLRTITLNSYKFYKRRSIPKKNGKLRFLYEPNQKIKAIQYWILRHILSKVHPSSHATAYIKGKSIKNNISPHQNNRYFLNLDIKEFFPSIKFVNIEYLFETIGYNKHQSKILALLCTCNSTLPQGAITSPAISNLVISRLDRRISGYCSNKNIIYTRYADDLTFSSNNRNILNNSSEILKNIIYSEHFDINEEKTRFTGPSRKTIVTGLIKNASEAKFGIGKSKKNKMRSIIFNLIVNNKIIDQSYRSLDSILGWINYCKTVDLVSAEYMQRYYEKLKQGVK